jgi:hypothetical protein
MFVPTKTVTGAVVSILILAIKTIISVSRLSETMFLQDLLIAHGEKASKLGMQPRSFD